MTLIAGTRLGPYEVVGPLGAGGMGEVYKAIDRRLDRTVAVKVLPAHLSDRPEVRERFEREARTASSLNHPHICTLYDIGRERPRPARDASLRDAEREASGGRAPASVEEAGIDFLVMEYLDGETLASRLARGPLPVDEVLRHATEIADALDKAHRQGVVHRDLKPGNIMLTRSGGPSGPPVTKLLDFGLAKHLPASLATGGPSVMPTEGSPLTVEGSILGTLQYMAPEQLEGREADPRTDIFAFGALLYEMATGRRAFEGKSQVSLIAAIVEHDPPPISSVQPVSPPLLDHLVKTCLAKNPDRRWQSMADVLIQLKLIGEHGAQFEAPAVARRVRRRMRAAWAAAAALLGISVTLVALVVRGGRAPDAARISFEVEMPSGASPLHIALSPDGRHLAAVASSEKELRMLWVRSLEHLNAQVLSGTEGVRFPFWSRDGRFIAFFAGGKLKKVDIFGAPPQTLCDVPDGHRDGLAVLREADPPAEEEDEILVDGALAAAAACAAISWRIRTSGPWS